MLATDEAALICDLAETYHIYDYRSLPLSRVATFAVGLRENSRIKMKMANVKYPMDIMLLACVVDRLSVLTWMKTADGANGQNRPQSILARMLNENEEERRDIEAFDTPEEFEIQWYKLLGKEKDKWVQN